LDSARQNPRNKINLNFARLSFSPMMSIEQIINDFSALGSEFLNVTHHHDLHPVSELPDRSDLRYEVENSVNYNPWFIPSFVRFAFKAWAEALQEHKIAHWLKNYLPEIQSFRSPASVGIIMAGNIPMVGLHDLLCVLASGHKPLIRLSSSDDHLIPAVLDRLVKIDPELKDRFTLVQGPLKNFNAVIATGNNNSSRYFEYYFGRYPHIIRKNRNGVAVLTGQESAEEIKNLATDIFMYFGLGCRNVSKLYLPEGLGMEEIMPFFEDYAFLVDHNKYRNNYDYHKSIFIINRIDHKDNGFLLAREQGALMSPISVIHTETYQTVEVLNRDLHLLQDHIQCIISIDKNITGAIPPGRSQFPELWEYADGLDTMDFLMAL
jgi:hypothetical protein